MKLPAVLTQMPAQRSAPAAGALPPLPKPLAAALTTAEALLADRAKLRQLLEEQTRRTPVLLSEKLESQSQLAHVETGHLLGELAESDVEDARNDFEAASAEYSTCVAVQQSVRARLVDPTAETQFTAAKQDLETLTPEYTQQVADAFTAEYRAAAAQFASVLARGNTLSTALRVAIDMPAPQTLIEPVGVDAASTAGLAEATRIGSALDGLSTALNEITNQREQTQRERNRRPSYGPGLVWRFIRDYSPLFQVGDLTQAPIISESLLERLHRQKIIMPATAEYDASASAEVGVDVPMPDISA